MATIFHITTAEAWAQALPSGAYLPEAFAREGFIHCSTREQVLQVANARFRGQAGLVLLAINTDAVLPEIVYENLEGGQQLFPHIYGPLNTSAVTRTAEFPPGADNSFSMPETF